MLKFQGYFRGRGSRPSYLILIWIFYYSLSTQLYMIVLLLWYCYWTLFDSHFYFVTDEMKTYDSYKSKIISQLGCRQVISKLTNLKQKKQWKTKQKVPGSNHRAPSHSLKRLQTIKAGKKQKTFETKVVSNIWSVECAFNKIQTCQFCYCLTFTAFERQFFSNAIQFFPVLFRNHFFITALQQ